MRNNVIAPAAVLALAAIVGLGGCDRANEALEVAVRGADETASISPFNYTREYLFLAPTQDGPIAIPFDFQARERGEKIERTTRAWLARGPVWARFLDQTVETSASGGVWRVVPAGDLRLNVGGAAGLEAIHFERAERQLRLEFDSPLTEWHQGSESRFRLLRGRAIIGTEVLTGPVLELLRYEETLADGWPPGQDYDALFLSTGDSIQMVLAETLSVDQTDKGFAWLRTPSGERSWDDGELRWLDMRVYEEARRDIPTRWSYQIPGADVTGELEAVGFDAVLGPERGGRRAVEIRYTVTGWMEIEGQRRDVVGAIRHTQQ